MEAYFATSFEDFRHERSLILLLSLIEPDIFKRSEFTEDEIDFFESIAPEKLNLQRNLKEIISLELLEKQFCD